MGSGIGILTAAAILLGRTWLPQLFSQDPYVIAAASRALPIVAFSMVCPPPSHDSSLHDVYESASFSTQHIIPPTDSTMCAGCMLCSCVGCRMPHRPHRELESDPQPSAVQLRASEV